MHFRFSEHSNKKQNYIIFKDIFFVLNLQKNNSLAESTVLLNTWLTMDPMYSLQDVIRCEKCKTYLCPH